MLMPSWDPIVGTLGGVLDPKVVISHLNTEWSQRQGLTSISKNLNVVFQTNTHLKCKNCNWTGHIKVKCWAKVVVKGDIILKDSEGGTMHEPPSPSTQSQTL